MDENFNKDNMLDGEYLKQTQENSETLNSLKAETENLSNNTVESAEPQPQPQPQPKPSAPFVNPNPQRQTPPVAFSGTGNGYTPYGYYPQRPVAPKSASKNKKTGLIIAVIIVAFCFFICGVIGIGVVTKGYIKNGITSNDKNKESVSAEIPLQDTKDEDIDDDDDDDISASAIYKKVCESNVGVLVYYNNQSTIYSEGSGVILPTNFSNDKNNGKTYIVTCAHVLEQSSAYKTVIQLHDGTQYDATIVGLDKKTDIGVVSIKAKGLKAAQFASTDKIAVGETVYALGNPGGSTFFGSFTNGMVSAIGRPVNSPVGYEVACIQHTAPINPGNSGGALLNKYGQVIGINSSKIASTDYEGMGFAVPSETVKEIVEKLIAKGYVTDRPVLGITLYPSTYSQVHSYIVKANDLPAGTIIINSIMPSSDLAKKDVKKGDMIIGFNGKDLDDYNDLLDLVQKGKVGDKLTLTICRVDQNYKITTFEVETRLVEDTGEVYTEETETTNYQNPFGFDFGN